MKVLLTVLNVALIALYDERTTRPAFVTCMRVMCELACLGVRDSLLVTVYVDMHMRWCLCMLARMC